MANKWLLSTIFLALAYLTVMQMFFVKNISTYVPLTKQHLTGALSGLRFFLAIESPLKMMKNAFYFTSKAFFVLKIFKFLSWLFGHVAKQPD